MSEADTSYMYFCRSPGRTPFLLTAGPLLPRTTHIQHHPHSTYLIHHLPPTTHAQPQPESHQPAYPKPLQFILHQERYICVTHTTSMQSPRQKVTSLAHPFPHTVAIPSTFPEADKRGTLDSEVKWGVEVEVGGTVGRGHKLSLARFLSHSLPF
jgi:hypothetical protein